MTENDRSPSTAEPSLPRRKWLTAAAAGVLSAVVGIVPLIPGVGFFLDPLIRRKQGQSGGAGGRKDADGFIRVPITVSALPEDGTPQQFTVLDDKTDAWNRFVDVPIGSIWLRRVGESVIAFNTTCPHLGCGVGFRPAQRDFFCPCHTSAFDLDGHKINEVPPRDMDALEVRRKSNGVVQPDGEEVWVRYVNYRAATSEKIPV